MYSLMIVDDSNLIRTRIQNDYDEGLFNVVAEASDGEEAIAQYKKYDPEVVTMDLTMPNIDGIGAIEQLVSMDEDIKILVISALNDDATGIEAIEKGALGFVEKPFTPEELREALEAILKDDE